ncbi:DUF1990 family protein [Yinghuangia soli]|uniref:DUF1990 domain-containing protein n=1 Tax=Yinghuangia soli TaxID=2908204 RepID=A0AA41U1X3_9ACTN|nr:DUF1990 domain-containing protein [Yinghuangia soli]MCF2530070.1 DUF1990 domain-containing protein [Yinghuangia soli]
MATARLTYTEIGATLGSAMPPGYHHVERRVCVGSGERAFRALAEGIMRWEIQRGAGLEVRAAADRAAVDVDITCVTRVGPVRVPVPCRVVAVVDEAARAGFAYGTLPGHPERGEEAFLAEMGADGEVWFVVRAFSRPGPWWAKLGAPVAKMMQKRVTDQYVRAGQRLAG